jgi:hypothetical protein
MPYCFIKCYPSVGLFESTTGIEMSYFNSACGDNFIDKSTCYWLRILGSYKEYMKINRKLE